MSDADKKAKVVRYVDLADLETMNAAMRGEPPQGSDGGADLSDPPPPEEPASPESVVPFVKPADHLEPPTPPSYEIEFSELLREMSYGTGRAVLLLREACDNDGLEDLFEAKWWIDQEIDRREIDND